MSRTTSLPCLALLLAACASRTLHPPTMAVTPSQQLCRGAVDPKGFCLPAEKLERFMKDEPLRVVGARRTAKGTNGAMTLWLDFPRDGVVVKAKWKEAAHGGSALNNEPRKELAVYAMQKLFLDPQEYVVPPTAARCIPLDYYDVAVRPTRPTFDGTACAFGVLAYWVEGIRELGGYDARRFEVDLKYRATICNLNLLTYLVDHRDSRASNFALSKDPDRPRALALDNGLAFSGLKNPRTAFRHEWEWLQVSKLPHDKVERLRRLTRADLDALGTVAEFRVHGGQLDEVPPSAPIDADAGVRQRGDVIQLGLTRDEIDGVWDRVRSLLHRVDTGEIEEY